MEPYFKTWDTFRKFAEREPEARIRVYFRTEAGQRGEAVYPANTVLDPNRSDRFFPPGDTTAASWRWDLPYWYRAEIVGLAKA